VALDLAICQGILGWMSDEELCWLHARASGMRTVLEVGTWLGRSASALAQTKARVWTVDHFQGSPSEWGATHTDTLGLEERARANLARFSNVRVLAMSSFIASRKFSALDMVFIDGEHTTEMCLVDLVCWAPKVRKLLCGHDRDWEGVQQALAVYGVPYAFGPGSLWYMEMEA